MRFQPTARLARFLDWMFRDRRTGSWTVAQWPNLPLWLFAVLTLASGLTREASDWSRWLAVAADLALGWWAADELLRGVNPWRRLLGAATLAGLVILITLRRAP
jgi:hypothetical protein